MIDFRKNTMPMSPKVIKRKRLKNTKPSPNNTDETTIVDTSDLLEIVKIFSTRKDGDIKKLQDEIGIITNASCRKDEEITRLQEEITRLQKEINLPDKKEETGGWKPYDGSNLDF